MNTIELKSDLHNLIDKVNDISILNALKVILSKQVNDGDFWDDLPLSVKQSIDESIKQSERGETVSHEEVMKDVKLKYGL